MKECTKPYKVTFAEPKKFVKVFGRNLEDAKFRASDVCGRRPVEITEIYIIGGPSNV